MTRLVASAFFGLFLACGGALLYGLALFIWSLAPPWVFGALFIGGFTAAFAFDVITGEIRRRAEKRE